jgi:Mce-associated membrane protein
MWNSFLSKIFGRWRRGSTDDEAPSSPDGGVGGLAPPEAESSEDVEAAPPQGLARHRRTSVVVVVPLVVLLLACGAGWLKWRDSEQRGILAASSESVRAASESTVAMLSYKPATVDSDLQAARDRLTGPFRDSFTSLVNDVVIPGAKEKQIFSTVNVPAAASISADDQHALVLVYVNQTTVIANDPPTETASSVKVSLDKVDGRWLVSDFAPI